MTTNELISALEEAGYEWRSYSGRGMCGEECVGVPLDGDSDLWKLARDLAEIDVGQPTTDNMGRGLIAYWPRFKITEER
jgi:hypothetical protein